MNALLTPWTSHLILELACRSCPLGLVGSVPALGFLLQAAAVGTAIGAAVSLRASRRYRDADTWAITTAWATLALVLAVAVELASSWS